MTRILCCSGYVLSSLVWKLAHIIWYHELYAFYAFLGFLLDVHVFLERSDSFINAKPPQVCVRERETEKEWIRNLLFIVVSWCPFSHSIQILIQTLRSTQWPHYRLIFYKMFIWFPDFSYVENYILFPSPRCTITTKDSIELWRKLCLTLACYCIRVSSSMTEIWPRNSQNNCK